MDNGKKEIGFIVFGLLKMLPEIFDHRALCIQKNADHQLDMRKGGRPVPYTVICF